MTQRVWMRRKKRLIKAAQALIKRKRLPRQLVAACRRTVHGT